MKYLVKYIFWGLGWIVLTAYLLVHHLIVLLLVIFLIVWDFHINKKCISWFKTVGIYAPVSIVPYWGHYKLFSDYYYLRNAIDKDPWY